MQGEGVEPPRPLATGLQPASVADPTLRCGLTGTRTRFCRLRTCGPTHGRSSRGALAETRTPRGALRDMCSRASAAPSVRLLRRRPPPPNHARQRRSRGEETCGADRIRTGSLLIDSQLL